jgi:hypothetical protein
MATHDRTYGTTSDRSTADSRLTRDMRLDWSALFGGTVLGWGVFLLISMMGMILGLSVIDPFGVRPAVSNSGAAIWGAASAIIASFVGAFFVVRLAGDRRRSESLAHGAVSWGMSMLLAGMIALFASGIAAFSRTPAGSTVLRRGTRGQTVSLVETTGNSDLVAIFAAAGAVLALVGSNAGIARGGEPQVGGAVLERVPPAAEDVWGPQAIDRHAVRRPPRQNDHRAAHTLTVRASGKHRWESHLENAGPEA